MTLVLRRGFLHVSAPPPGQIEAMQPAGSISGHPRSVRVPAGRARFGNPGEGRKRPAARFPSPGKRALPGAQTKKGYPEG